jgi:hypothetical protein
MITEEGRSRILVKEEEEREKEREGEDVWKTMEMRPVGDTDVISSTVNASMDTLS